MHRPLPRERVERTVPPPGTVEATLDDPPAEALPIEHREGVMQKRPALHPRRAADEAEDGTRVRRPPGRLAQEEIRLRRAHPVLPEHGPLRGEARCGAEIPRETAGIGDHIRKAGKTCEGGMTRFGAIMIVDTAAAALDPDR